MVETMHDKLLKFLKLNFAVILTYGIFTTLYEAWQLITPYALMVRWILFCLVIVLASLIWLYVRRQTSPRAVKRAVASLIAANIAFVSANIYFERGMASRAVMLYSLPIIAAGLFRSKSATFLSALFCALAYSLSAIWYSVVHPSEGYKIEIYGTIIFYCTFMFVMAGLVNLLSSNSKS